jgi:hypothetical protein
VVGDVTSLPAGIELSGYRIVEHLLGAIEDEPRARVEVTASYSKEALEITVNGPPARLPHADAALAAARERAALHAGTLTETVSKGRRRAVARLPLAAVRT